MAEELAAGAKVSTLLASTAVAPKSRDKTRAAIEAVAIPAGAIIASLLLFGIFVGLAGHNPLALYDFLWEGWFGNWFSIQNSLTRASPLILTALCCALPAQLGL